METLRKRRGSAPEITRVEKIEIKARKSMGAKDRGNPEGYTNT